MIEVRKAKPVDFEKVFPLFEQLAGKKLEKDKTKSFFEKMISSENHFGWIAFEGSKAVGYVDAVFSAYHFAFEFTARIETIIVDESMRRKGIASLLMKKCEEKAKEMGYDIIELDSRTDRKLAHKFYEKQGFEKRGYLFWKKI